MQIQYLKFIGFYDDLKLIYNKYIIATCKISNTLHIIICCLIILSQRVLQRREEDLHLF